MPQRTASAPLPRTYAETTESRSSTLAGLAVYVDGDGVAAGIAFDAASAIGVDPSLMALLEMLDASHTAGIKPEAIAELAAIGVEVVRSMGIDLDTE